MILHQMSLNKWNVAWRQWCAGESGEVCESRSFFECREEAGGYFWRNASIPAETYLAHVSKFELFSDPRVRTTVLRRMGFAIERDSAADPSFPH